MPSYYKTPCLCSVTCTSYPAVGAPHIRRESRGASALSLLLCDRTLQRHLNSQVLLSTCTSALYMPLRPHTTAANEKLKLAASAPQPRDTMKGSPCNSFPHLKSSTSAWNTPSNTSERTYTQAYLLSIYDTATVRAQGSNSHPTPKSACKQPRRRGSHATHAGTYAQRPLPNFP